MPTGYCGGDAGSMCDSGMTGLCLSVAAAGVCENAVGTTMYDTTDLENFEFMEDADLGSECNWEISDNGYLRQSSNANRYDGTQLGCNALLPEEYTDFIMEIWMDNQDNDGIGMNFGWKSTDDFFRVHKINDQWNVEPSDYVDMPVMKARRKIPGKSCADTQIFGNSCMETIGFVDTNGMWHKGLPADGVVPAGECGYSDVYQTYDQGGRTKMYIIVKDGQMRATYESPSSKRQVTVMNFNLNEYNYTGGRVGISDEIKLEFRSSATSFLFF